MKRFKIKGIHEWQEKELEVIITNSYVKITDITTEEYIRLTEFENQAKKPPAIAGTYYPDPSSDLAVISVLEKEYFTTRDSEGGKEIEIEMIEGTLDTIPFFDDEEIVY